MARSGSRRDLENARRKLNAHLAHQGLKQTRQRESILEAFMSTAGHVTSEDVHDHVREIDPTIGAATVYRTLKLFCDAGITQPGHFRDGVTVYEHSLTHHDHLICLGCGDVVEFECELIEDEQLRIAKKYGFVLKTHRHELYGFCPGCEKANG